MWECVDLFLVVQNGVQFLVKDYDFIQGREFVCVAKQVLAFLEGQLITS